VQQPETHRAGLIDAIPDSRGQHLSLDFGVAPATGYLAGADLDNLCE
jgi:hypothetical protein